MRTNNAAHDIVQHTAWKVDRPAWYVRAWRWLRRGN